MEKILDASNEPLSNIKSFNNKQTFTKIVYLIIGCFASFIFTLVIYKSLLLDSSITGLSLLASQGKSIYLWIYIILTALAILAFGVNTSLLVYRIRKYGWPKIKTQGATGLGSVFGIFASACPSCGSTLLSIAGIAGGIVAFPFAGLELKFASLALLALPIWLTRRDVKKLERACSDGTCPPAKDDSFGKKDLPALSTVIVVFFIMLAWGWNMAKTDPIVAGLFQKIPVLKVEANEGLYKEYVNKVIPEDGFHSKIALNGVVQELVKIGAIDEAKFISLYEKHSERAGDESLFEIAVNLLKNPDNSPILLTNKNSGLYLNILWPLGLSNHIEANKSSPILDSLFDYASTGGWTLGKEENGGAYFNKYNIVSLTQEQEVLAVKVADSSYRPWCGNSAFYQDCNHGSALLALLELGASQGLTEDELYREALAFNSFWFQDHYINVALYLKLAKGINWEEADPKMVMSKEYSSGNASYTIKSALETVPGLLPPPDKSGAGCSV